MMVDNHPVIEYLLEMQIAGWYEILFQYHLRLEFH